jgi:Ras-related protein Rab-5C
MYYRNAQVAVLVFDVTNILTFNGLSQWVEELNEKSPTDLRLYIVGNKVDLAEQRVVATATAREVAEKFAAVGYFETSALTGVGVTELFQAIAESGREEVLVIPPNREIPSIVEKEEDGCC